MAFVVAHLVLCHLLWRIAIRSGASIWIATLLTTLMAFLGAGSQNILWEFQMAFVAAIAFALGAVLLLLHERLGPGRIVACAALALCGLASTGTAIPVVIAAAVLAWRRHGFRRAVLAFGPPFVLWLVWYLTIGRQGNGAWGPQGFGEFASGIPQFSATMLVGTFDAILPIAAFGGVVVAAVAWWTISHAKEIVGRGTITPYLLLGASVIFALITAFSRYQWGMDEATGSRLPLRRVRPLDPAPRRHPHAAHRG